MLYEETGGWSVSIEAEPFVNAWDCCKGGLLKGVAFGEVGADGGRAPKGFGACCDTGCPKVIEVDSEVG